MGKTYKDNKNSKNAKNSSKYHKEKEMCKHKGKKKCCND